MDTKSRVYKAVTDRSKIVHHWNDKRHLINLLRHVKGENAYPMIVKTIVIWQYRNIFEFNFPYLFVLNCHDLLSQFECVGLY